MPERGHAKNLEAFQQLAAYCSGFGTKYNPSRTAMQLPSVQTTISTAAGILNNLHMMRIANSNSRNSRSQEIDAMIEFTPQVIGALEACGAPAQSIKDAKMYYRKMKGRRAAPLPKVKKGAAPADPPEDFNSAAQTGITNQIEHYAGLIAVVEACPGYNPNELELQVTGLKARLDRLIALNKAVQETQVLFHSYVAQRQEIMYKPETGMGSLFNDMQNYVKSVFGAKSIEYKQVKKIRFVTQKYNRKK